MRKKFSSGGGGNFWKIHTKTSVLSCLSKDKHTFLILTFLLQFKRGFGCNLLNKFLKMPDGTSVAISTLNVSAEFD